MPLYDVEAGGRQFEIEAPSLEAATAALMQHIRAPNGDTVRFPADTPDATILDVMRREYGGPAPRKGSIQPIAPSEVPQPSLGQRVRDVFTGELRTEFPEAPEFHAAIAAAERARGNVHSAGGLPSLLSSVTPDPRAQLDILRKQIPDLEDKTDAFGNVMLRAPSVGVTGWSYLNRPGLSDRDVGEFVAGTAVTAPFIPLFGAGASIPARLVTGALAGAGGSVAQDVAAMAQGSEQGVDPTRAVVSGAVGSVLGPLTPRAPTGRAPRAPTPGQEAVLAGERIGVPVPRAMATESTALQQAGGVSRGLPFGGPVETAAERTTTALGEAAERVAAEFGSAAGPLHAGDAVRQGLIDWLRGGASAVSRRLYEIVERRVNPNLTVPLAETRDAVLALERGMLESATSAPARAIDMVREAINRPGGLTFRGAMGLRTELGAMLDDSIVPASGTHKPALKQLYEALTVDIGRILEHAGGDRAVSAWRRANDVHRAIAQQREQFTRILGLQGDAAPEQVFERLGAMARGKTEDFGRLMQARHAAARTDRAARAAGAADGPDTWSEIASSLVARLGRTPTGEFSPARFVTEYGKISLNGRNALFGQGGLREALDDIATVSQRFEATISRYANRSGTGRAGTVGAGLYGVMVDPLHALGSLGLGYALSGLLAQPVTARAVAKWANAYTQAATRPGQATATLLEQAQRQLFEAAEQEGVPANGDTPTAALPATRGTTVRSQPPGDAGNVTVQTLLQRGVHPENARLAIGNPRLAIAMLQRPDAYREPVTAATRVIEQRRAMGTAVGGVHG